jgi:hypothetical protein
MMQILIQTGRSMGTGYCPVVYMPYGGAVLIPWNFQKTNDFIVNSAWELITRYY